MQISLKKVAEYVNGNCVNCGDAVITSVTTDTRKITQGSLFVALKGERFDGHNFAADAVKGGAAAVISERKVGEFETEIPIIEVEDSYKALLDLSEEYRQSLDLKVVGVTGSVGKTTTKDMISAVLSQRFETYKTQGNLNNHIGVPQTIFSLTNEHSAAVIEMGMNHKGEISVLSKASRPDIAVITSVGVSHIENLGSRENILKAKLEILDYMKPDAPIIINAENDILSGIKAIGSHRVVRTAIKAEDADIVAKNIKQSADGSSFDIFVNGEFFTYAYITAVGRHNIENALLACAVGVEMGLSKTQIAMGLSQYVPSGMRQRIVDKYGIRFIEDCYNASPTSMLASLSVLNTVSDGRKIAVLGDMLELGDMAISAHYEVGEAAAKNADVIVCVGSLAKEISNGAKSHGAYAVLFESNDEAAEFLKQNLEKNDCVLFKASHSMHFEEIISKVYNSLEGK